MRLHNLALLLLVSVLSFAGTPPVTDLNQMNGILITSKGGTGANHFGPLSSVNHTVYIDSGGDDSTATGNASQPYATYAAAYAHYNPLANQSSLYTFVFENGSFVVDNISPYISLIGKGVFPTAISSSGGGINLNYGGNNNFNFSMINIGIFDSFNVTYTVSDPNNAALFYFNNVYFSGDASFLGSGNGSFGQNIYMTNCRNDGATLRSDGFITDIRSLVGIGGNLTVTDVGVDQQNTGLIQNIQGGQINRLRIEGGPTVRLFSEKTNSWVINGSGSTVSYDGGSYQGNLHFQNGATYTQLSSTAAAAGIVQTYAARTITATPTLLNLQDQRANVNVASASDITIPNSIPTNGPMPPGSTFVVSDASNNAVTNPITIHVNNSQFLGGSQTKVLNINGGTYTLSLSDRGFSTGTAEVIDITTIADVGGNQAGAFVKFSLPNNTAPLTNTLFVPWEKVGGSGSAPSVPGATLIEVDFPTNSTADAIATAWINAVGPVVFTANGQVNQTASNEFTITGFFSGAVPAPVDGTTQTHFTIAEDAVGANPIDGTWIVEGSAAAGLDTQIQFNDGGAHGSDPNIIWSRALNTLALNQYSNFNSTAPSLVLNSPENNGSGPPAQAMIYANALFSSSGNALTLVDENNGGGLNVQNDGAGTWTMTFDASGGAFVMNNNRITLVGSPVSSTDAANKGYIDSSIESARITCGSSSSVSSNFGTQQSNSWIASITPASTGACSVTLAGGFFNNTTGPACTCSGVTGSGSPYVCGFDSVSNTQVNITVYNNANSPTDHDIYLMCSGKH